MSDLDMKHRTVRRAQSLTATDRAEIIRGLEFGPSLRPETVSQLAENSQVMEIRRRRFVYRAGDEADALYAIVAGRIKLCRIETETSREAVIDILPQGSLFGESALYSKAGRRENSAIAYEGCTLLKLPAAQFKL